MNNLKKHYDVVIVGSGVGGGSAADYLMLHKKKELSVLMLEAGPYWKKEKFSQRESEMINLFINRGAVFNKQMTVSLAAARAVGGSSAVYTGVSFRPPKSVLEQWRSQFGLNFLSDDYVKEVLDKIEHDINVHELPLEGDNENNTLFKKGCDKLGISTKRLRINTKNCKGQGFCNLGCSEGAKQGTLEVQIPRARQRGMQLVHNATVIELTKNNLVFDVASEMKYTEANVLEEGRHSISFDYAVIAAGVLNTSALLLRSKKNLNLKNKNIGRYVSLHPAFNVNGIYNREISNFRGFPKSWLVDEFSQSHGYFLETSFYYPGVTAKNIAHFGMKHFEIMQKYNQMMSILILSHDEALSENRITIDKKGNAVLDYKITKQLKENMVQALRKSGEIFFAAGCSHAILPGSSKYLLDYTDKNNLDDLIQSKFLSFHRTPLSSAHPQGGTRMGDNENNSVVNIEGHLHEVDNIFIADASLFPTSVKVNPYETVMLLAQYVASRVLERL